MVSFRIYMLNLSEYVRIKLSFIFQLDGRRMKIVEIGGAQELLNMLQAAKDDRTRKEALKALAALSLSGQTPMFVLLVYSPS